MRSLVAVALVLLTGPAAYAGPPPVPLLLPDRLGEADDSPPLGCRHLFPQHAWCVEQAAAAEAFRGKCLCRCRNRPYEGEWRRWWDLQIQTTESLIAWRLLAAIQDPTNACTDLDRRVRLSQLHNLIGPSAFHAGRMPPPVPEGAPRD